MIRKFPFYKQLDQMDCGPTCLKIIAKHYGYILERQYLRKISETSSLGSSIYNISEAAEKIGFRSLGVKINLEKLKKEAPLPCILFWNNYHFVVLYKIKGDKFYISDPSFGLIKLNESEFISGWIGTKETRNNENSGIVLLLEPTPRVSDSTVSKAEQNNFSLAYILENLKKYKKFFFQMIIGLLIISLIQLAFPYLTQSIVDVGIINKDLGFIYLVFAIQIALFFGRSSLEIIRSWILLHISTRFNVSLLSDFLIKLMRLPISYFDSKLTGDLLQRINDHQRIEKLFTSTSLEVIFSILNIIIFSIVLGTYNFIILNIFVFGNALYLLWVLVFMKKRKTLDYKLFSQLGDEQSKIIEIINGMQSIKLHGAERQKRWEWQNTQAKLYKISIKSLALEQLQTNGAIILHEIKNMIISVVSAMMVINGQISLGVMLAIAYILGQLNSPIQQLVGFIISYQDAKLALERLSEIHTKEEEEKSVNAKVPQDLTINIKNLTFRYPGTTKEVLKDLSVIIPKGKTTAIVGSSGSGKTTLMKILLKFYDLGNEKVTVNTTPLESIPHVTWRNKCGIVMQDGYIFNDSIANNIALGAQIVDSTKLQQAIEIAKLDKFINDLPLGIDTMIGSEGVGISGGQKQRILIARAIYKKPDILFFDEATSSLDTKTERSIVENLDIFLKNKTAIVIAHRLSTVKNADQIIVLDKGRVVEIGNHKTLIDKKGRYHNLVSDQLELNKSPLE